MGNISTTSKFAHYRIRSKGELQVIIDHFTKYPLHTSKLIGLAIFMKTYNLTNEKAHIKVAGLLEVAALANKLNKLLSDTLSTNLSKLGALPNVTFESPTLNYNPSLNPY